MAKKKKKGGGVLRFAKWALAVGGGAVVGAYTVRFIDRRLGLGPGGAKDDAESPPEDPLSPTRNPLAVHAISPVMPVPVAVPQFSPFPTASIVMPPPPTIPTVPTTPSAPASRDNPARPSAAELRQAREARFEELVQRFQDGELD